MKYLSLLLLLAVAAFACHKPASTDATQNLTHATSFVVYPADTNHLGTLFGGKTMAEMDRTAGITVRRFLYASKVKDAVTVSVEVKFRKAGSVKDLVVVSGEVTAAGKKSVTVAVKAENETPDGRETLAEGVFVFVAFDTKNGVAAEHGLTLKLRE